MKIHDLKRTSGKAVLSVWPPQVLADVGTTFVRPGDGVLKGVRRIAKRLSLVIEHGGREVVGRLECDVEFVSVRVRRERPRAHRRADSTTR